MFAVGLSTLGAEIAAARLMAPFFGSSTLTHPEVEVEVEALPVSFSVHLRA